MLIAMRDCDKLMGEVLLSKKLIITCFLFGMKDDSNLFVLESSDDENGSRKRQRLDLDDSCELDIDDTDFSEWEDIAVSGPALPESFSINIESDNEEKLRQHKRDRLKELMRRKRIRLGLQYLSIVSYTLHLKKRNQLIASRKVLKKLKKLVPETIGTKLSQLRRLLKQYEESKNIEVKSEADKLLVYILKYFIKWHRLNYKINSNGMRVLGYLPEGESPEGYYPSNSPAISSTSELMSVIKGFKHNRDTGAVIFTAILRSLGFNSRLVMSLPLLSTSKHVKLQPKLDGEKLDRNKDNDLLYPYYWTELVNPLDSSEIFVIETMCFYEEDDRLVRLLRYSTTKVTKNSLDNYFTSTYFPKTDQFNQMPPSQYIFSIDENGFLLDVSPRYIEDISYRYFNKLDLRTESGRTALLVQSLIRYFNQNKTYKPSDNSELDLLRLVALVNYSLPSTFTSIKRSPNFVTHSTLLYNEVIDPSLQNVGKVKFDKWKSEPVFFKNSVIVGKSEQQWKFLGRSILPTQLNNPIKTTRGYQPRTIYRRRIFNYNTINNMDESNETKLYSFSQTCPYIKEVVTYINGEAILPRNKYGNIEIFKETMIPDGCIWLKLTGIEKILNDYRRFPKDYSMDEGIKYVPVVIGFDFRAKAGRAIPVKEGVLLLKEQEVIAKRIWIRGKIKLNRLNMKRKEELALRGWHVFLRRLEIKQRVDSHYL